MGNAQNQEAPPDFASIQSSADILKNYEIIKQVEDFKFGDFQLVKHKQTQDYYMLKEFVLGSPDEFQAIQKVLEQKQNNQNQNQVKLLGYTQQQQSNLCGESFKMFALFEYFQLNLEQDIKFRKQQNKKYTENEMWKFLFESVDAFAHNQESKKSGGDIRPENLLLTNNRQSIKILDSDLFKKNEIYFQLATGQRNISTKGVYLSPDLMKGLEQSNMRPTHNPYKSDVFSLAMTMINAGTLENCDHVYNYAKGTIDSKKLSNLFDTLNNEYSAQLIQVLRQMSSFDETSRPDFINLRNFLTDESKGGKYTKNNNVHKYTDLESTMQHYNIPVEELDNMKQSFQPRQFNKELQSPILKESNIKQQQQQQQQKQQQQSVNGSQNSHKSLIKNGIRDLFQDEGFGKIGGDILKSSMTQEQRKYYEKEIENEIRNSTSKNDISVKSDQNNKQNQSFQQSDISRSNNNNQFIKIQSIHSNQEISHERANDSMSRLSVQSIGQQKWTPQKMQSIQRLNESVYEPLNEDKNPSYLLPTIKEQRIEQENPQIKQISSQFNKSNMKDSYQFQKDQIFQQKESYLKDSNSFKQPKKEQNILTQSNLNTKFEKKSTRIGDYLNSPTDQNNKPFDFSNKVSEDIKNDFYHKQYQPSNVSNFKQSVVHQQNVANDSKQSTIHEKVIKVDQPPSKDYNFTNERLKTSTSFTKEMVSQWSPTKIRKDDDDHLDYGVTKSSDQKQIVMETFQNGSKYEGEKLFNMRNGKGKFFYADGGIYNGNWQDNKMHGYGILFYSNGKTAYEGMWYNDQFQGKGILFNEDPINLSNTFNHRDFDQLDNYWTKYEGDFFADSKEGFGELYLSNGEKYVGSFSNDQAHGKGTYYKIDGSKIQGNWTNNKLAI